MIIDPSAFYAFLLYFGALWFQHGNPVTALLVLLLPVRHLLIHFCVLISVHKKVFKAAYIVLAIFASWQIASPLFSTSLSVQHPTFLSTEVYSISPQAFSYGPRAPQLARPPMSLPSARPTSLIYSPKNVPETSISPPKPSSPGLATRLGNSVAYWLGPTWRYVFELDPASLIKTKNTQNKSHFSDPVLLVWSRLRSRFSRLRSTRLGSALVSSSRLASLFSSPFTQLGSTLISSFLSP
ncbi:hypothetical protein A4X13_0g9411 [Tilletia indica]|uniref:Uncharacterized protein n=1 Tax=Tilletia indica TaxID=43049 RepID=A0A8T8S9V6_9BASI|nr:hypothetical protein A4X13_0g9411 [Tilletia indica]